MNGNQKLFLSLLYRENQRLRNSPDTPQGYKSVGQWFDYRTIYPLIHKGYLYKEKKDERLGAVGLTNKGIIFARSINEEQFKELWLKYSPYLI